MRTLLLMRPKLFRGSDSVRQPWQEFTENSPILRRFALKVCAIVPHAAACERVFSGLGLVKTKPRNRLVVSRLDMFGQLRNKLQREGRRKKVKDRKRKMIPTTDIECSSMGIFNVDETVIADDQEIATEICEELDEVNFELGEVSVMEIYFDFEAYENGLSDLDAENDVENNPFASSSIGEDFSIDNIMNGLRSLYIIDVNY